MENATQSVRLVRCPKCLRVLAELPGITLYKCGGCDAILRAKIQSNSGDTLSLASVDSNSKDLSENSALKSGLTASGTQNIDKEQVVEKIINASDSNPERYLKEEFSGNQKNDLTVSDSNKENLKGNRYSSVRDENEIKEIMLEQELPEVSSQTAQGVGGVNPTEEHQLEDGSRAKSPIGEVIKSSEIRPEANVFAKSSDKLKEFSESEEDMINAEFRNVNSFRLTARSSLAYDGSASSTDEGQNDPAQKYLLLSRRTFRNKKFSNSVSNESEDSLKNNVNAGEQPVAQKFSGNISIERLPSANAGKTSFRNDVQSRGQNSSFASEDFHSVKNLMESEKEASSRSQTKDIKQLFKFRYSQRNEHAKILKKVDDLRDDISEFFNKTASRRRSSRFSTNVSNFEGKVPPKQYRSSLIPVSNQPKSSCLHCQTGGTCCHNDHCRPCPHNICCHLPEPANGPPKTVPSRRYESQNFKRHCRPVSGGSPFVICYRCFKVLQLPADFLVSTKKVHKLRCGDCSQVLIYTFRPRIRSVPETPAEVIHPSSVEEDDCNGVSGKGVMDPVSYSEEYGFSFGKSFSYEANNEIVEEEDEGDRGMRSLHLHNLMGYSSARQLLC